MDDPGAVEVLDAPEDLVEEHLDVVRAEMLRRHDDLVKVALHELGYEVDFLEKVDVGRLKQKTKMRYLSRGKYILFYDLEVCQHSRVHVYLLRNKRKQGQAFVCSSVMFVIFSSIRLSYVTNKKIYVLLICSNTSLKEFKN